MGILFHNVSFTTSVLRYIGVGILVVHRFRITSHQDGSRFLGTVRDWDLSV